jgi:hypothetical protein
MQGKRVFLRRTVLTAIKMDALRLCDVTASQASIVWVTYVRAGVFAGPRPFCR